MIFSFNKNNKSTRSASQIFKDTLQLCVHNGQLCLSFNLVEDRKGYGAQFIPTDELEPVSAVLLQARDKGIVKETEQLSTSEILKKSLIETEEGEVRFKTEDSKGKKPTVCSSKEDFDGFVDTLAQMLPEIKKAINEAQKQIEAAGGINNLK